MTIVDDVFAKLDEIIAELEKVEELDTTASEDFWPIGDVGYVDFKSITLPISQDIVTLVGELNVLTS